MSVDGLTQIAESQSDNFYATSRTINSIINVVSIFM